MDFNSPLIEILLSKRLHAAIAERGVQQASFDIFASQQGSRVETWKEMVKEFEADGTKPNPYEVPKTGKVHAVSFI